MNLWLLAVAVLQLALALCGYICVSGKLIERVIAMEMASAITVISVALLAEGMGRPAWFDLALALGLLSFPGGLVFLFFLEDWL